VRPVLYCLNAEPTPFTQRSTEYGVNGCGYIVLMGADCMVTVITVALRNTKKCRCVLSQATSY
jgi:hypothetical protein